jgi:hypothetical protein
MQATQQASEVLGIGLGDIMNLEVMKQVKFQRGFTCQKEEGRLCKITGEMSKQRQGNFAKDGVQI